MSQACRVWGSTRPVPRSSPGLAHAQHRDGADLSCGRCKERSHGPAAESQRSEHRRARGRGGRGVVFRAVPRGGEPRRTALDGAQNRGGATLLPRARASTCGGVVSEDHPGRPPLRREERLSIERTGGLPPSARSARQPEGRTGGGRARGRAPRAAACAHGRAGTSPPGGCPRNGKLGAQPADASHSQARACGEGGPRPAQPGKRPYGGAAARVCACVGGLLPAGGDPPGGNRGAATARGRVRRRPPGAEDRRPRDRFQPEARVSVASAQSVPSGRARVRPPPSNPDRRVSGQRPDGAPAAADRTRDVEGLQGRGHRQDAPRGSRLPAHLVGGSRARGDRPNQSPCVVPRGSRGAGSRWRDHVHARRRRRGGCPSLRSPGEGDVALPARPLDTASEAAHDRASPLRASAALRRCDGDGRGLGATRRSAFRRARRPVESSAQHVARTEEVSDPGPRHEARPVRDHLPARERRHGGRLSGPRPKPRS